MPESPSAIAAVPGGFDAVAVPMSDAPLSAANVPLDLARENVEALLRDAIGGRPPEPLPLRALTARLVASLSPLERAALAGQPTEVDPAPLCAAAALRWRAAAVLERGAPATPEGLELARALTAQLDEALAALKALSDAAPPPVRNAVAAARNGLVRNAIALTEAIAAAAQPVATPAPGTVPAPREVGARVLSNEAEQRRRAPVALAVVLACCVAIAAAYQGWLAAQRRNLPPRPRLEGAPAGFVLSTSPHSAARVLVLEGGRSADPAEIARFRAEQALKGVDVIQVSPRTLVLRPAEPSAPAARGTP